MALTQQEIQEMEQVTGLKYSAPTQTSSIGKSRADEIRARAAKSTKPSFMDALTGKAQVDPDLARAQGVDVARSGVEHITESVKHPVETAKGVVKGVPRAAAGLVELADTGISKVTSQDGTMLDYDPIKELTAPSNVAQETGVVVGGMLPVERAVSAAGPLVKMGEKYLAEKAAVKSENFIKDLITPELTPTKTTQAIKTGKVTEGGVLSDRDITGAVPFFEDTAKAVSEVPGISKSNTLLENANAIHGHIGTIAEDLKSQIKGKGFFSPAEFNGFMNSASEKLNSIPSLTRDATEVANKYLVEFNKLVKKNGYTPEGLLQARKDFDNLIPDKQLSPDIENGITEAVKYIRQGANEFLASKVPDVAVKEMLKKQTSLYNAMDNIAPKAAKEGKNKVIRWMKAHPKITAGATAITGAALGGGVVGSILK